MLRFNDDKVFVDSVDGQLVALVIETGSYYTFNEAATAVLNDLTSGHEVAQVAAALKGLAGDDAPAKLESFIKEAVEKGVIEESSEEAPANLPAMTCSSLDLSGGLSLEMDGYDDVAAYFMVDPIHEVDPSAGWPHVAE
jgi:hypothetical protein